MRRQSSWGLWMARVGCGLVLLTGGACGDDADDAPSKAGSGGANGSAGKAAAGQGSSTSGVATAGRGGSAAGRGGNLPRTQQTPNAEAYRCQPKPEDKGGFGSEGARCCVNQGSCAKADGLPGASSLPHDTCSAESELVCSPNPPATSDVDAGTGSGFASCRVKFPGAPADYPDYEGRCLPSCFAQKSPIAARLQIATCAQGQLCTPCYDPLTGASTGSCELQGDAPTEPGPKSFAECANGLGYCVPAFAAGMFAGELRQLTCQVGELCGPKNKVADPSACFEQCESAGFGPGSCVPEFLASNFSAFLSPSTCTDGNLCAPCSILNQRTGVCD